MTEELKSTLAQGLAALSLTPPEDAVEKLSLYCDLLLEQNRVMNLTAIHGEAEILPYTVPGTDQAHNVVRIRKRRETPEKYPRRWAKIQKQPL